MSESVIPDLMIDPITGRPWARWQDTNGSARYLQIVHGIPIEPKTFANRRASGAPGPVWKYFGQRPLTSIEELDRFAEHGALSDRSPLARPRKEIVTA